MALIKKMSLSALSFIVLLFCVSCDKTNEQADITLSTTLSQTLPVSVVSTGEMTTSVLVDATTDPEIQKHASNIKKYEVTELKFAIDNYNSSLSDEIYFYGLFGFSKKSENAPDVSCAISPLNVTHFAGTGFFNVGNCDMILPNLSDLFIAENAVNFYLSGNFDNEPLSFDLKMTAKIKITASPL